MENVSPLVSVVIIFLNAEKFIQEAIESVLAQTYHRWELLLVDDGSTDGSTALALQYARQDAEHVRYLEHDGHRNRGMSASRNLGIRHARGEYIAFLDADDVWLPHKLEEQVAVLNTQPEAVLVYGRDQYWYSWSGEYGENKLDHVPKLGVQPGTLIRPPTLLPLFLLGKAAIPCPTNILARRTAIERVGGFDESFRGAYEDQAFYVKVLLRHAVIAVDKCWDRYRQHFESNCAITQQTGHAYLARERFLSWLRDYLLDQGVEDSEVWKALRKAQWRLHHPALARVLRSTRRLLRLAKS